MVQAEVIRRQVVFFFFSRASFSTTNVRHGRQMEARRKEAKTWTLHKYDVVDVAPEPGGTWIVRLFEESLSAPNFTRRNVSFHITPPF